MPGRRDAGYTLPACRASSLIRLDWSSGGPLPRGGCLPISRYGLIYFTDRTADRAGLSEGKRAAREDDQHGEEVFDGCTAHVNPRFGAVHHRRKYWRGGRRNEWHSV